MELNLGPLSLRLYSGSNWTHAEAAWVTNRFGGAARRETAINAGFKSDHLTELVAKDNPADVFECPDTKTLFFGKVVQTPTGVYMLSAKEVYTKSLYTKAVKQGLAAAEASTAATDGTTPAVATAAA